MDRWEKAQLAELRYKSQYYGAGFECVDVSDSTPEYLAVGVDPLSVQGKVLDIGGALGSFTLQDPRIRLLRTQTRSGKSGAQNLAVEHARGEILFTDANTRVEPHALERLVENFADPRVGLGDRHDPIPSA